MTRSVPAQWLDPIEHDVAEPVRDQLHAAQDEGAHDDLAQLAVGLHQRQQVLAIQLDHLARLAGTRPDERAAAREHLDLAGELTRSMDRDQRLGGAGWLDDLDLTFRDHEERHDLGPRFEEHLAALDRMPVPVRRDARDLRRASASETSGRYAR